ncbi:hypothetical protein OG883_01180 [Streptomyces sp. NBC_01142]|uniref:hypothetical protein n=1 Tax=Streptomyces sp. NBC_01142 TaxID=2975865 RepID=UPI002259D901|nr:hypothetical protein [Streptomyces sp. NBC_01142]MCX4818541.1 hypothetical protein [Streptomyces sp. NBC_01142]
MKEIVAVIGSIVGIQGVLGFVGRTYSDQDWGLLQIWFHPPTPLYIALAVVGGAMALWGEAARKRA